MTEPALESADSRSLSVDEMADLYRRYAPQGTRYAFSMLRNTSDAEDITQDAFCRLLSTQNSEADGNAEGRFRRLFFASIRNLCIDRIRAARRHRNISFESSREAVANPPIAAQRDTSDGVTAKNIQRIETCVVAALEDMPRNWSDALKLKINGELSYAEIANILNSTHAQVRTWIYRARRRLETALDKAGLNMVSK